MGDRVRHQAAGCAVLLLLAATGTLAGRIELGEGGERAPVVFDHVAHANALAIADTLDCTLCHRRDRGGRLSFAPRAAGAARDARAAAHRRCGDCHVATGRGPHPALCAACHDRHARTDPEPRGSGLTALDHDGHVVLLDGECGRCHHAPDPITGRPVPTADVTAACADCHGGSGARTPMRQAAHASCVGCHERGNGPVACADCHGS